MALSERAAVPAPPISPKSLALSNALDTMRAMDSPSIAVDLDAQAEGLEDRPLQLGIGVGKLGGSVGERYQSRTRLLGVKAMLLRRVPLHVFM